ISDNAVVAAPMNWRAESTGDALPLSRRRYNWLKSWQKSIGHALGCATALELEARSDQGSPPESATSCGPRQTVTFIRAWARQNERQLRHLHTDVCLLTWTSSRAMRGGPEASLTKGGIGGTKSTLGTNH